MSAPQFTVREVRLYERDVRLRMPFRFGVVTLTQAPQCFVRARIELADGRSHWGAAAELLAPKWFDKNLALSNEDNFDQLRLALRLAADAYCDGVARTAFGHFAAHYDEQIAAGAARGLNALVANFGPAQIDRAILDALCRSAGCSFYDGDAEKYRGHRCGAARAPPARSRAVRHRALSRATRARRNNRRAPHRRPGRRHWRPSGASQRRPAGVAGGGRRHLRPHAISSSRSAAMSTPTWSG